MKLGVSTYSLYQAMQAGEMSYTDVIAHVAAMGAEHIEIVPLGVVLSENPELVRAIKTKAFECGIELSNYAIGANFCDLDDEAFQRELDYVKREVDVAAELGISFMRHDIASSKDTSISHFLEQLPRLVHACREIALYAAQYNIVTSIENHGYFVQHSDRVQAIVKEVNRPNFRTTLDIGNFLCQDENPLIAVQNNISIASVVHIKDFYYRPADRAPGEGWFPTASGNWLRGAIAGHGDIDIPKVLRIVKESGFDGYLSIEFEGMEECRKATELGFHYVKRTWESIS